MTSKAPETFEEAITKELLLAQRAYAHLPEAVDERNIAGSLERVLAAHTTEVKHLQWLIDQQKKERDRLIAEHQTALEAAKREARIDGAELLAKRIHGHVPLFHTPDKCKLCAVVDGHLIILRSELSHPNQPKETQDEGTK